MTNFKKITIEHFDCPRQKIHEMIESYVDLKDGYLRYVFDGWISQWDDEKEMLKPEKHIYDDDIYLLETLNSVRISTTESGFFNVEIFFMTAQVWVRFKKLSEARAFRNEILLWANLNGTNE